MNSMNPWSPIVLKPGGLADIEDDDLLALMKRLATAERTLSVYAIAQLAEIQRRRLYRKAGYTSMFVYCVKELGYAEVNAYRRILAAQAARRFPESLALIKSGEITICALSLISKHLTQKNSAEMFKRIEGKSFRAVERIVAELAPRPDTRDVIRTLAAPITVQSAAIAAMTVVDPAAMPTGVYPAGPDFSFTPLPLFGQIVAPSSRDRVQFSFTAGEELRQVVERCRDLLSHKYPSGRLEDIFLELGHGYLRHKDLNLLPPSKPKAPRQRETRYIPRWVRSVVYKRDGAQCVYTSPEGLRCESRRALEFDHIIPWARGGRSDDPLNIRLLCRVHNVMAAEEAGLA